MTKNKYNGKFDNLVPKILLAAILFLAGVWVGQNVALPGSGSPLVNLRNTSAPSNVTVDFAPFWSVWEQVTENHLNGENVDPQKLLYGAISGMVNAVGDPYSVFLDPGQNGDFLTSLAGTYEGVGIELGARDEVLTVVAPLEGTPAEKAGIRAGDFIVGINGEDTADITIPEAVQKIRGEAGTKVTLTIKRGKKEPFDVEITRGSITVESVRLSLEKKVPVIRLSRFGDNTKSEWDEIVSEVVTKNYRNLVLDLRNNPGGRLDLSVYIAGEFLSQGKTILIQESASGDQTKLNNERSGRLQNVNVVVLINEGSASASEIVAAALSEGANIKLVGQKTFGKGTIQQVEDLVDGSGLHLTTAKWLTPNGVWVNEKGITPDTLVKLTDKDIEAGRDPQLNRAISTLTK